MSRAHIVAVFLLIWLLYPTLLLAGPKLIIPKPTEVLLPPPPPPTLEPSVVNLTVSGTLREIREAVESSIAVHHRHEENWVPGKQPLNQIPFDYQYYIWRGPVNFRVEKDRLVTEFPDVRYRIRVRMKHQDGDIQIAECGYGPDAHMRMSLEAVSEVRWSTDWVVHTDTGFSLPQFREPCRLSPLDIDVTELLRGWLEQRLPPLASAIDEMVLKHVEAKKQAQLIWGKLQQPMELSPNTWLTYRPKNPRAGSLTISRDQQVHSSISMTFDPAIVAGPRPYIDESPLPELQIGPTAEEGFHLAVPMVVSYEEVSERLSKDIVGKEIIPPVGSTILITGVRIYGSGNNLISEVAVTGGVNGKLYLQGRPVLTPDGHTLEFRDFDFTVETSNLLVNLTNRAMHDTIRENILPNTKIEVGDRITGLRRRVERQMNRELSPGIWLHGAVTNLAPRGIYPIPGGIEVQFVMDGTLTLTVQ